MDDYRAIIADFCSPFPPSTPVIPALYSRYSRPLLPSFPLSTPPFPPSTPVIPDFYPVIPAKAGIQKAADAKNDVISH